MQFSSLYNMPSRASQYIAPRQEASPKFKLLILPRTIRPSVIACGARPGRPSDRSHPESNPADRTRRRDEDFGLRGPVTEALLSRPFWSPVQGPHPAASRFKHAASQNFGMHARAGLQVDTGKNA